MSVGLPRTITLLLALCAAILFQGCEDNTVIATQDLPHDPTEESIEESVGPFPGGQADNPVQAEPPELPTCVRYVDVDSSAALRDGLSWATSFTTVQEGIDSAVQTHQPCEVWVAEGVYLVPGISKDDTIQLRPGISVYGGFSGTEIYRKDRDWNTRIAVLDGGNRLYHVVTGSDESVLDGFQIAHGKADGLDTRGHGGGMINPDCSPRVENCVFRDNKASKSGAGMWNRNGSPKIARTIFRSNQTSDNGGGMASQDASPAISGCTFEANAADEKGGAIYFQGGNPLITNSLLVKNRATHGGGGLAGEDSAVLVVVNCTFSGNEAGLLPLSPEAGAVILDSSSGCSIANSILWGDKQPELNPLQGTYNITYTAIVNGLLGLGNLALDPMLDEAAGYRLRPGSPCIDAADATQAPDTDKDGKARLDDPNKNNTGTGDPPYADLGAYEYIP